MSHSIQSHLEADHRRLDALLLRALAHEDALDHDAYEAFRRGLLKHIAVEEKILFAAAGKKGGAALAHRARLHRDHAAFAAMLIPTPTRAILDRLAHLLEAHNRIEEGDEGAYAACGRILGEDAHRILEAIERAPEPHVAKHVNSPAALRNLERLAALAEEGAQLG